MTRSIAAVIIVSLLTGCHASPKQFTVDDLQSASVRQEMAKEY